MSDEREQNVVRGDDGVEEPVSRHGGRWGYSTLLGAFLLLLLASLITVENRAGNVSAVSAIVTVAFPFVVLFAIFTTMAYHAGVRAEAKRQWRAQRAQRRLANLNAPPPEPPAPFEKRLAAYLHVPEEEVLVPRERTESTMPFWCAVELPQRSTMAKSIAFIRRILLRIRAAVRGNGSAS